MGKEIERKFLLSDPRCCEDLRGSPCKQGYLAVGPPVAIRVRIMDGVAILNIKKATLSITRDEYEYPIPLADAEEILDNLCDGYAIQKTRYKIVYAGMTWEVDVFEGLNQGLAVAEIELAGETQGFERPPWVGAEVSGEPRYLNSSLSRRPYAHWSVEERSERQV